MVDLYIHGVVERDVVAFSLNNETKFVDQFSKGIHFLLEKGTYRVYFEQKSELFIHRYVEIVLKILFFPIRTVFNVITFNTDQSWENDISAFKISGYIDVDLQEDTEISFRLKHGCFEKRANEFKKAQISFFPNVLKEQFLTLDVKEIQKAHGNYLQNIGGASGMLFALLLYLCFVGFKNRMYIACALILIFVIIFICIDVLLVLHSFMKKRNLLITLSNQKIL